MNIFDYHDYKQCINDWIKEQPQHGHGQLRRLALHLGVNSVVMSQVFRGSRDLTLEQALSVSEYIGLTDPERDYLLLLIQQSRAGSHQLKKVFSKQLEDSRRAATALKNRVAHQKFTDEDKATFYSQWYYSAIRLGVSIPKLKNIGAIAEHLNLDRSLVAKVVDFLLKNKLIVSRKDRLEIGPQVTHVGHDSPFVTRHHINWRLKSLQALDSVSEEDLFYTGPMALSEEAAQEIRQLLVELVTKSTKKAAASESEVLRCLNIDWFSLREKKSR
ncbi:TIGR02147 family protein [Bdellovibrio bacteriovorus]|uniref:TIGR02147 family protein n=1 Tax=Bdellovibrio TaxID=958 RepID=UPI0035A91AA6